MGRRHDWTLRPELMRRKAVPVGNWPTVGDIPPGALVLDEYGELWVSDGTTLISVTAYLHNEFGDILMNEFDEPIMAQYE